MEKYETDKHLTWGVMGAAAAAGLVYVFAAGEHVPPFIVGAIIAVGVAGLVANRLVANGYWKAVGREVGLTPRRGWASPVDAQPRRRCTYRQDHSERTNSGTGCPCSRLHTTPAR